MVLLGNLFFYEILRDCVTRFTQLFIVCNMCPLVLQKIIVKLVPIYCGVLWHNSGSVGIWSFAVVSWCKKTCNKQISYCTSIYSKYAFNFLCFFFFFNICLLVHHICDEILSKKLHAIFLFQIWANYEYRLMKVRYITKQELFLS